jgi:hypothetical protein
MSIKHLFTLLITTLLIAAPTASTHAAPQNAVRVVLDTADYPNALCNDSTPAAYYIRGAGLDGAISGNKWLIFLHGGGHCGSDESCAERWYDPNGGSDGFIGYHGNMTTAETPTKNFNGEGILDIDGVDNEPTSTPNPFAGFNRIMVPYCSSDTWSGSNTTARSVNYSAYVGTTVNIDGKTVTIKNPGNLPNLSSIRFSGQFIAEAVIDSLMTGGIRNGKKGDKTGSTYVAPPSTATDEVVIAGSSAGGGGVIRNLDKLAGMVSSAAANVKTYGIIDSSDTVGVLPEADITGATSYETALFYGVTSTAEVDSTCEKAYPLTSSDLNKKYKCYDRSIVLRNFLETPHYVVQNAYDGVIHGGLMQVLVTELSAKLPPSPAQIFAELYIRNQISLGARELGAGVINPEHTGWFIANYTQPKHQLLVEDIWFYNSASTSYDGNNPRLDSTVTSTMSLPRSLACFRFKVTGQGSCVNPGDAKIINTTYPATRYEASTSTLTLPFVKLSNNTYYKDVKVVLSPIGSIAVGDNTVSTTINLNEYSVPTNVIKLPKVTVGNQAYDQVSVSNPGLKVLEAEKIEVK